jgi:hypothetical protein
MISHDEMPPSLLNRDFLGRVETSPITEGDGRTPDAPPQALPWERHLMARNGKDE